MGVAAFATDDAERILFIRENYGLRRYGFPGGEVETGESLHEALLREFREEVCAEAVIDHLIALDHVRTDADDWWLYALFACRIGSGVPRVPDSGEIAEVLWIDPRNPPTPLTHAAAKFLHVAVARQRGVVGWLVDDAAGLPGIGAHETPP